MLFEILFSKFNKFYEKIFHKYGFFLSKYPLKVIITSVLVNILLAFGSLRIKMITDTDDLFMIMNSEARRDEKYFSNIFGCKDIVREEFYMHQLFDFGTGAEIQFRVRNDPKANILEKKYFDEINSIHKIILQNSVFKYENETLTYESVCVRRSQQCWIEGASLLDGDGFFTFLRDNSLKLRENDSVDVHDSNLEDIIYFDKDMRINLLGLVLGKEFKFTLSDKDPLLNANSSQTYGYARILKLRYQMKYQITANNMKGILWEREFLKSVRNLSVIYLFNFKIFRG